MENSLLIEYWEFWLGILTSGGLSSILTMRIGVKSAKSDLMIKIQAIYGKIIDDLRTEITIIRDNSCSDKKCDKRIKI